MKRRTFLKILSTAPAIAAVPALANSNKKQLYLFGEQTIEREGGAFDEMQPPDMLRLEYSWLGFGNFVLKRKYELGGKIIIEDKVNTRVTIVDTIRNMHIAIPIDISSAQIIIERPDRSAKIISAKRLRQLNYRPGLSFTSLIDINTLENAEGKV